MARGLRYLWLCRSSTNTCELPLNYLCFYLVSCSTVPTISRVSVSCLNIRYPLLQCFSYALSWFKRCNRMLNCLSFYGYSRVSGKVRQVGQLARNLIFHILIRSLRMRDGYSWMRECFFRMEQ